MQKLKLLAIFLLLGLAACTEPIVLDLNTEENVRLIVDAEIDNQTEQDTIFLSLSSNFFERSGRVPANGATVIISDGLNDYEFEEFANSGNYISPAGFVGIEGNNYRLTINYKGKVHKAQCILNPQIRIDTLTATRLPPDDFFNPNEVEIGISFQDPKGVRNYYLFIDYVNGKNEYEDLFEYGALFNDNIVDGFYLNNIEYGTFDLKKGDTLSIELRAITKEVEKVLAALASESFSGGIFDSPPSNVVSNIDNGALGIFTAYSKERKSIIIEK